MGVKSLMDKSPEDILEIVDMSEITKYFPHWHSGYDKLGRPVIYKQYGGFEISKLLKVTTMGKTITLFTSYQLSIKILYFDDNPI